MVFINFIHYEVVCTIYCFIGSPLPAAKPLNALYAQQNRLARRLDCLILGEPVSYSVIEATKIAYKYMFLKVASIIKKIIVSAYYTCLHIYAFYVGTKVHDILAFVYNIIHF
jgi:hypothetical protein